VVPERLVNALLYSGASNALVATRILHLRAARCAGSEDLRPEGR
jgi:hypothetical protein